MYSCRPKLPEALVKGRVKFLADLDRWAKHVKLMISFLRNPCFIFNFDFGGGGDGLQPSSLFVLGEPLPLSVCLYSSNNSQPLTFQSLPVTWCTTSLTFNNCTLCPHCIYVFCVYLRTNSDLCHLQHKLIGFYNRDEKCLQRGTDWVFK